MRKTNLLLLTGLLISGSVFCQNEINVTETALKDTVETGNSSSMTFTIQNTGDADLEYEISVYTDTVLFTKEPYADYTHPDNQDLISPNVIITRGELKGLFNYAQEEKYNNSNSPIGTLWNSNLTAGNSISDYNEGTSNFGAGDEYSMYIPAENRFFDIFFHLWTEGGLGSGFSYTRVETVPWLTTSPESGTISGGNEQEITVTFDVSNTGAGIYNTAIVIHSNDADESELIIPVTLVDTGGTASIDSDGAFDFGAIAPGNLSEYGVVIYNTGDGILEITDISTQTSNFTATNTEIEVYGYLQTSIKVTFEPSSEGEVMDTLLLESNAGTLKVPLSGTGYYPPYLTLDAEVINFSIDMGASDSKTLTLSNMNTKGDSVVWSIPEKGSLAYMLANINDNIVQLKASVPDIFEFDYDSGEDPDYYISDGGADMYDDGNYLNTNYESEILYSDNVVRNGDGTFGEEANYFTRNIRGYFIMVAQMDSVTSFSIEGNNGADSDGTVDTLRGNIDVGGVDYLVVTKQVNEQDGDPSINHIFILETPDSLTHLYDDDTDYDYDEIQFGKEVGLLHYLLVASRDTHGVDIDSVTIFDIVEQYLEIVNTDDGVVKMMPDWLSISGATPKVISENSSEDLSVTANAAGLAAGDYHYTLVFSNLGQEGLQSVDVNLTVNDTTTYTSPVSEVLGDNTGSVSVYPNPVSEVLFVEAEIGSKIIIYDAMGKLIYSSEIEENNEQIYVGEFSPGIYIVQIKSANTVLNKQFVIE